MRSHQRFAVAAVATALLCCPTAALRVVPALGRRMPGARCCLSDARSSAAAEPVADSAKPLPEPSAAAAQRATAPVWPRRVRRWTPSSAALAVSTALILAALPPPYGSAALPRLFRLHVLLLSPMLALGTAGVTTLRSRTAPPPPPPRPPPAARKRRMEVLVKLHFALSATALYAALAGVAAIFQHKQRLGRAHFATIHSCSGAFAVAIWLAAYLSAQPNVWRDVWKQRRLVYAPRWLWASRLHKNLGLVAYMTSLVAFTSALTKPIAHTLLGASTAAVCAALTAGIGMAMVSPMLERVRRRLFVRAARAAREARS